MSDQELSPAPAAAAPDPKAIVRDWLPENWADDIAANLNRNVLKGTPTN